MSYTNFPNGISSMGVPIPIMITGKMFFVDLENGLDSNSGKSIDDPKLTIAAAVSKCVDGRGDGIGVFGKGTVTSAISITIDNLTIFGIPSFDSPQGAQTRIANSGCNIFEISNCNKVRIEDLRLTVTGAYSGIAVTSSGASDGFNNCFRSLLLKLNTSTSKGISFNGTSTVSDSLFEDIRIRSADEVTATWGIGSTNGYSVGNIYRALYFDGLTDAMTLPNSRDEVVEFCTAMNCTASIGLTGTTSSVKHCWVDVAVSGTAKVGDNTTLA